MQKRFRQGKVRVTTSRFLGYDSDENGELVINPAEAEIVRRIFREYIVGKSIREIKKGLESDDVKTITGLAKWPEATLRGILTNEKYHGDALLQKTYTPDYLTHNKKMKQLIRLQIKEDVDPMVFQSEYGKLKAELDKLREERNKIGLMDDKREEILKRTKKLYEYLLDMEDILTEFDDDIFGAMVERILVISPTHLKFELKNGLVLEEKFIKKKGIHGLQ